MFAGLFVNVWTFIALFTIIMFGCLYEFTKMMKLIHHERYFLFLPFAFLYIVMPMLMMIDLGVNGRYYTQQSDLTYSALLPCAILFSLWINDTMAYLVGSVIGKTPFSKISPKKTWEGTIGGALLCVISMTLLGKNSASGSILGWQHWIVISSLCALFGTLGDLLESKLKRMANIKDSGSLMPGHGGFLDRFDSLLIATPVVWLYIRLFV